MPTVFYKYINKQEQLTAVERLRKTTTKTYFANNVQNQQPSNYKRDRKCDKKRKQTTVSPGRV